MIVAIDFETYLISEEEPIPKPVCMSYYDGTTAGLCVGKEEMRKKLLEILDGDIIAHNAKFEFLTIYKWFPEFEDKVWEMYDEGRVHCTQVHELLANNVRSSALHSTALASVVNFYFEEDISASKKEDAWRLRYSELDGVPKGEWPKEAVDYAVDDSIWAFKIYELQKVHTLDLKASVQADFSLNLMAATGFMVHKDRVKQLDREIEVQLEPMYQKLLEANLIGPNLSGDGYVKKMNEFKDYIKEIIPKEHLQYTSKGSISTGKESIKLYCIVSDDEVLTSFQLVQKYEKIRNTYIKNIIKANPYLRTSYNPVVSSGRTSSRKSGAYPSINIQNMPRAVEGVTWDIRNCCIPREGYKLVSIDYSSLELTATAQQLFNVYKHSAMLSKLNSGDIPTDMHSLFGCKLKSMYDNKECSYEEFMRNKKKEGYAEFRKLAKPINLGFPGGIGYDTMRTLLLKEKVDPTLAVIYEAGSEKQCKYLLQILRERGHQCLRIRRLPNKAVKWTLIDTESGATLMDNITKEEGAIQVKRLGDSNVKLRSIITKRYQIVYDEIVKIKNEFLTLYPELKDFLWHGHEKFKTGEIKYRPNEFGEFGPEEMYSFQLYDIKRNYCTYTSFCNGFLMQTPAAIGAKRAMYNAIKKYYKDEDMNPLAFIHDEIVFEVKGDRMIEVIDDVSQILIDSMQEVLPDVRISVEATVMDYWDKGGGEWEKTYWKNPKEQLLRSSQ